MSDIVTLVCQECLVSNRVPLARLQDHPKCGRCHQVLFEARPLEMDEAQLQAFQERDQSPLLVDFWAPWCGPCRQMAPEFGAAASTLEPRVRLAKVDTERCGSLAARYGIRSIPTMILFDRGQEIARQSGAMNRAGIVDWVSSVLPAETA